MEKVTIIVNARDRFSPTAKCMEFLFANTPESVDFIVVIGGAPEHLKKQWMEQFSGKVKFLFRPEFLNQSPARNIALREAKTRLAVLMDNDNYVRLGWLEAIVKCQQETGAALVVPIILEPPRKIHTAGNDLYVTSENGKEYGHKHLRYHGMVLGEKCNLKRQRVDYAELHCQLVEVEPMLKYGAYDDNIREVGEVDQGMIYAKAGLAMWFEPGSVVLYDLGGPIYAEDIRVFAWRWDMRGILEGYKHFDRKWGMDITEHGGFKDFLLHYNAQIGLIPRLFPTRFALWFDKRIGGVRGTFKDVVSVHKRVFRHWKKGYLGYNDWLAEDKKTEAVQ